MSEQKETTSPTTPTTSVTVEPTTPTTSVTVEPTSSPTEPTTPTTSPTETTPAKNNFHPKKLAASRKEGAKKGQDLSGLEDMGGVHFFHVVLDSCDGKWELVTEAMEGANTPVDPAGEDRKGGAQNIGKCFMSANADSLCIYLHVPEAVSSQVSVQEWFDKLVGCLPKKHQVLQAPPKVDQASFGFAKIEVQKAKCQGEVFPLKLRDEVIGKCFEFLRKKGVVPEDEESSDFEAEDGYEW